MTNLAQVEAVSVGVYWDSDCSSDVNSIDWGSLDPRASKTVERNPGFVKETTDRLPDFLTALKVRSDGWTSEYRSVNELLKHLARKTKSESSRNGYCWALDKLCIRTRKNPDELIGMPREWIEKTVQDFVDKKVQQEGCSRSYGNNLLSLLETFFRVNGFEESKRIRLQKYKVPTRTRVRPEYIPTAEEVLKMANTAGSLRDRGNYIDSCQLRA